MKVGLYSIACSGTWYKDVPALTVEEFVDFAKEVGFTGVEIDLKRPHGSPLDLNEKRCAEIRSYIDKSGLELTGVAANNNFSSAVPEHLENELIMVREQIKVAKMLGAPVLRLFAAWPGITFKNGLATYEPTFSSNEYYGALDYEKRMNILNCLKESAEWAKEAGVMLALQNHSPVIVTYRDMLDFVKWVNSPWLKCCFDAPNLGWTPDVQSDEYVTNAVREVGDLQMICHASAEFVRDGNKVKQIPANPYQKTIVNYPAYIKALKEVGFQGYINYEYCHVPFQNGEIQGFDYVKDQIRLAYEYFTDLVNA